jgi:hypothetical protein
MALAVGARLGAYDEMLTGKRAFEGADISATLAADGAFLTRVHAPNRASQDFTLILNWPDLLK